MTQEQVANWVVLIITVGALCIGLLSMLIGRIIDAWDSVRAWWGQGVQKAIHYRPVPMSSWGDDEPFADEEESAFSPATTTRATSNNALQSGATNSNDLLLGQARALAAMVKAGKIGETEGIKMVFGVSPSSTNPRYIAARAALKDELAKLEPPKFRRSPEQERARDALGLNRS